MNRVEKFLFSATSELVFGLANRCDQLTKVILTLRAASRRNGFEAEQT